MSSFSLILLLFALIIVNITCQTYPFRSWMADWSSSDAGTFGVYIGDSTIFDITWPGAHRAGMSFDDSDTNPSTSTSDDDDYKNTINSLNSIEKKKDWSARQRGSILDLLNSGVRFFDLQFQYDGTQYYSYNGLLGRSVDEVYTTYNIYICPIIYILAHSAIKNNIKNINNNEFRLWRI